MIREHWGGVLRLVASLQAGTVLPSAMLRRLAAFQRQNQIDLALQELGRIERTLFIYMAAMAAQIDHMRKLSCQAGTPAIRAALAADGVGAEIEALVDALLPPDAEGPEN